MLVLWFLFALLAALSAAKLIRRPSFWRTETPALVEVLGVWLILTLVMMGSLIGLTAMIGGLMGLTEARLPIVAGAKPGVGGGVVSWV